MKKVFMSMVLMLFTTLTAFAEVQIPQELRVKNLESGVCVWCAIENLANIHGVSNLKGIAKYRHDNYGQKKTWVEGAYMIDQFGRWVQIRGPHWSVVNEAPGSPERVIEEFKRLNVKYKLQDEYNYDTAILIESMKKKLGCAVGFANYPHPGARHMVTLTELTEDKCVIIDNNSDCPRIEKSREWFFKHWTGYTILIYPDKKTVPYIDESRETIKPEVEERREKN